MFDEQAIAILGGTGDQGLGLALRFASAGRRVVIGSRVLLRAQDAATQLRSRLPDADVSGYDNSEACRRARIVILSVPFEHVAGTLKSLKAALAPGHILVSMGVPLATAVGDSAARTLGLWQGSCAELVAQLAPEGVAVVSAFQNVSAHRLQQLPDPVECDVVVSGPKQAREAVMALCPLVPGLRAVDGGALGNARFVEGLTALLIGLNQRYRVPEGMGWRLTGLPGG